MTDDLSITIGSITVDDGQGNVATHAADDIESLAQWTPGTAREIAFMPARVLLQDFTGVPAVVDLAAMRDGIILLAAVVALMLYAGWQFFPGWIVFALLVFFVLGTRHPRPLRFEGSLGPLRVFLLLSALLIFVTSFTLVPVTLDLGIGR